MRLTLKLTLALALGGLVVLAGAAAFTAHRGILLFDQDVRRDHALLGSRLARAVERLWQVAGADEALAILVDADRQESNLRVRWRWLDGLANGSPPLPEDSRARLQKGEPTSVSFYDEERLETLCTYVPVRTPEERWGAIELREPLFQERSYVQHTIKHTVLATVALVAICGCLALSVGVVLVGRPIAHLVDKVRRVGSGDLSADLALRQQDEIGELAREMNDMCRQLQEARDPAAPEPEAVGRTTAVEQLRHADRLRTVGKLASGIAHELGTPLGIVTGRAQLVMESYPSGTAAHENASIVLDQARRMTTIIRQLLDFARGRPAQRALQDVHQLLSQTLGLLRTLADKHRVVMELSGSGEVVWNLDTFQIQQALTNLLVNGIQAMPRGGNLVAGYEIRPSPRTSSPADGQEPLLHLFVRDHGVGMAREVMEHVFEPFFSTKEIGEGTGLGLSVAYGIVRDHAGWIEVQSDVGKGSCFSIWLPRNGSA